VSDFANKQPSHEDVVIAEIVKARGIRGEVACRIYTDFPERFDELEKVTLRGPNGECLSVELQGHWFHKGRVILKLAGYDSMTAAQELVGRQIVIAESEPRSLNDDEFFEYRLVAAEVQTSGGEPVGTVTSIMRTGASAILVVEGKNRRELLIPFVDDICVSVDSEKRLITISPPEGLLDL